MLFLKIILLKNNIWIKIIEWFEIIQLQTIFYKCFTSIPFWKQPFQCFHKVSKWNIGWKWVKVSSKLEWCRPQDLSRTTNYGDQRNSLHAMRLPSPLCHKGLKGYVDLKYSNSPPHSRCIDVYWDLFCWSQAKFRWCPARSFTKSRITNLKHYTIKSLKLC